MQLLPTTPLAKASIPILLISSILFLTCCKHFPSTQALENGLARTPPMGWLSWERFTCTTDCQQYPNDCINDKLYREMADKLVEGGYSKLGYKYVNIDDCWSELERLNESGEPPNLVANKARFPEGIEGLSKHIHFRGLKLGIYGDCGTKTCADYPAQLKSEQNLEDNYFNIDAKRFAEWEIDSFKFDGCNLDPAKAEAICPRMTSAIDATGRPMVVVCEWPFYMLRDRYQQKRNIDTPNFTLAQQACNAWRYYEDIEDSWLSVLGIVDFTVQLQKTIVKYHGPGHWFDPDQLIIGNYALSLEQARAQMALWSVWSAPLYMSNDLRNIDEQMAAVLKNEQMIAVDQDRLGVFGLMVAQSNDSRFQAFVKPVEPIRFNCPSFVVVYLNRHALGNKSFVKFKLREILRRVPFALVAQRYNELLSEGEPTTSNTPDIEACKQTIERAMTKEPSDSALLNKPLSIDDQPVMASLEERRIYFQLTDLYNDPFAPHVLGLNDELSLRVSPSGVRAVKLLMQAPVEERA